MKKIIKGIAILCVGMIYMYSGSIRAQKETDPIQLAPEYSQALDILREMSDFLASVESFTFKARMNEDQLYYNDHFIESETFSEIMIRRPNKIFADVKSDYNHKRFYYNGTTITLYTIIANYYAQGDGKATIDETLDFIYDEYGVYLPLSGLCTTDPYKLLTEGVVNGYYLGLHTIDDVLCHHLLFIEEEADWEIWIEDSQWMWPRRYVINFKQEEGTPKFAASLFDWQVLPPMPDAVFEFTTSNEVTEIEFANPIE